MQVRRVICRFREEGYMEIFLHNLLMLMPEKIHKNNLSDAVVKKIQELFSTELILNLEGCSPSFFQLVTLHLSNCHVSLQTYGIHKS